MNMYFVPVRKFFKYDYFEVVVARSKEDAYYAARKKYGNQRVYSEHKQYEEYKNYVFYQNDELDISGKLYHDSQKDDILTLYYKNVEDRFMTFFNVNWNDYTESLVSIAAPEVWSNNTYPNNGILTNYMIHTIKKLRAEKNIVVTKEYGLFNTGLFTAFYEPIFAYATLDEPVSFMTPYELGNIGIDEYPERANYFTDPSLLLFDWHYKINIHYKHILDDINNIKRLPQNIKNDKNILNNLNGSIETMKKRVSANYKLAIPQYFNSKIQLLLPLCLQSDDIPDLALVVTKVGNVYQGHTCLTLDMAYNNARLIAKPESNWLNP